MAYRGSDNLNGQLLWRQESAAYASSQSCSGSSGHLQHGGSGEFGFAAGDSPRLQVTLQRRSSSLPTGTVIQHLPTTSWPQHSSASRLDALQDSPTPVLIHLLLEKVMALTAEKQQLCEQNAELAMENQQLSGLVADMSDTLQQQQAQMRSLLALQRQRLLKAASRDPQAPPANHHHHQQQQPVHAGFTPVRSSVPPPMAAAVQPEQEEGEELTEVSASLPHLPQEPRGHQRQQQQQGQHSQHRQQQERVGEWLQERGWQEFQEKLEPVSSSSSSSLILAIEDSLLRC